MREDLIPETNWLKIKNTLHDVVLSSTSHGLPNIFKSKRILLKIIWTLFFLISLGYCSFSIIKTINSYFNWEYLTKIEDFRENPTEFPAITVCNLNKYGNEFAKNVSNIFYPSLQYNSKFKTISELFLSLKYSDINFQNSIDDENIKNMKLPLEDFVIHCMIGFQTCNVNNFEWFYDKFYGNCFTFNNGRNSNGENYSVYNITNSGISYGLQLLLFLGNQLDIPEFVQSSGVHVIVHNRSVSPNSFEGIDISNGEQTNIIVSRIFENKLENPYNDCKLNLNSPDAFHSDIFRAFFKLRKYYSQENCFDACLQEEINSKCNCFSPQFPRIYNLKPCKTQTELDCLKNVLNNAITQGLYNKCSPYCPQECNSIIYSLSTSHSFFPNPKFSDFLTSHPAIQAKFRNSKNFLNNTSLVENNSIYIDKDEFGKSVAMININYQDLKYTMISQIPNMSFEDLLSNLGGQLGLFIGISFLSFVEIFDALVQIIFILLDKSTNNTVYP